jgi:transposase
VEEEMNLIELSELLLDDNKAEKYLLEVGILKTFTHCDKCGSEKLGRIRRGKIKCYKCKHEWNIKKGSVLDGSKLEMKKFILFIKLVDFGFNNQKIQDELNMNRITVKKLRKHIENLGGR